MNVDEAKKLKRGDKLIITIPGLYGATHRWAGSFSRLTHGRGGWYIHYQPRTLAPPGQKVKIEFAELSPRGW